MNLYGDPYLGINLDSAIKDKSRYSYYSDEGKIQGIHKAFDFGLVAGVEYSFSNRLFVEARYQYGLANNIIGDADIFRNRTIQIGLGYKF